LTIKNFLDSEEEGGLRELALVVAVFAVADGADRQDDMDVGIKAAQEVYRLTEVVGALVDGEHLLLEEGGRALLAVVDNLAGSLEAVDMVGAEGQEGDAGGDGGSRTSGKPAGRRGGRGEGGKALEGVEDAGGVVHDTVGIDGDGEGLVAEALAYGIGKTRAHEENLFAGLYMEWGLGDGYLCAELHHFT
jgi:hypothetical protein